VTANLLNALGDWVLVYGHWGAPAMGAVGSAWSTTMSRFYMAAVLAAVIPYHDRRGKTGLRILANRAGLMPDLDRIRRLLGLGLPAATQIMVEIAVFAVATALIGRLDSISLAAHQIAIQTVSLTYMVPLGVGSAAAVRVGQALGRGDPVAAGHAGWTAMVLGAGFMSASALTLLLAPRAIGRMFTPDPAIIRIGSSLLVVAAFFQLFDGIQVVATGALRGAGDTRTPMLCHATIYWLIGLPLGSFLCFREGWGAKGLWTGLCLALILIGLSLLWVWKKRVESQKSKVETRRDRC
jgi:multidrug resistance protein, MATE family